VGLKPLFPGQLIPTTAQLPKSRACGGVWSSRKRGNLRSQTENIVSKLICYFAKKSVEYVVGRLTFPHLLHKVYKLWKTNIFRKLRIPEE
jgi:hypothetical protein